MKRITLLIPSYMPRSHPGATPTPYLSITVDTFELALAKLSPFVLRHSNATRLKGDTNGRFLIQEIVVPYEIEVEDEVAQDEVLSLAEKAFGASRITVFTD